MTRALLIGKEPAAELGYDYVMEAPYDAVVIGSLTLSQLLRFREERVLSALAEGKPVYLYTPGLPEAPKNRMLAGSLASAQRELKNWGVLFTDGGRKKLITAEEARPDAVVLGYPVITAGEKAHRGSIENLAGGDAALQAAFSLENQVRGDLPPFFIWHTVADQAVPVENSLMLASALTENHVPYELHLFTHGGHGSSTCTNEVNTPNRHNAAWVPLCTDWLAETLNFHL